MERRPGKPGAGWPVLLGEQSVGAKNIPPLFGFQWLLLRKPIGILAAGLAVLLTFAACLLVASLLAADAAFARASPDSATRDPLGDSAAAAPALAEGEPGLIFQKLVGDNYQDFEEGQTFIIKEGGSFKYRMKLNTVPTGDVPIRGLSPTDKGSAPGDASDNLMVSPVLLTFTPENAQDFQEVTVDTIADSGDAYRDASVYINHEISGGDYDDVDAGFVFVKVFDPKPGVKFSHTALLMREGGTAEYTVGLAAEPQDELTTIIVGPEGGGLSVSPEMLTFTRSDWMEQQTVTVTQDETAIFTRKRSYPIGHDLPERYGGTVRVVLLPRKPQDITLSASDFSVERGGVLVYTVQLAARPKSEATVRVSHDGGCPLDLSPGALTFTPDDWNAQQTVTVGVKLGAVVGECIINHSDGSGNTADATITVTDSGLRPLPQATLTGVQDTLSLPEAPCSPIPGRGPQAGRRGCNSHAQQRQRRCRVSGRGRVLCPGAHPQLQQRHPSQGGNRQGGRGQRRGGQPLQGPPPRQRQQRRRRVRYYLR